MSERENDIGAAVLGIPLIFFGLNLASYYYGFLVLWVLVFRDDPRRLALIFSVEALSYSLLLFEERSRLALRDRSLSVLYLVAALHLDPMRSLLWPFPRPSTLQCARNGPAPRDRRILPVELIECSPASGGVSLRLR